MVFHFLNAPNIIDTVFDLSLGNIASDKDLSINYIYSPKVACSTVKATLLRDDSMPHGPFEIKFCEGNIILNNPFFCITRNPYKRALSGYFNKIFSGKDTVVWPAFYKKYNLDKNKPPTFTEFLEILNSDKKKHLFDPHFRPQYLLCNAKYIKPFFIGRIERFSEIEDFLNKNNFEVITWSPHSQKNKYRDFKFSKRQIKLINNIYKKDFLLYDYDLNPLSQYIPPSIYQKQRINPIFRIIAARRHTYNYIFKKIKYYKNKFRVK